MDDTHDIPERRGKDGLNVTERKLYDALIDIRLYPSKLYNISDMEVDFAFPDELIAIEVNGPYHYTAEGRERDSKRKYVLEHEFGWKVYEYSAEEVFHNPKKIANKIDRILTNRRDSAPIPGIISSAFGSDAYSGAGSSRADGFGIWFLLALLLSGILCFIVWIMTVVAFIQNIIHLNLENVTLFCCCLPLVITAMIFGAFLFIHLQNPNKG